jgi:EAL domain-containing protein (putative c-di-GMP-specific phosphodiesterase class I)
VTALQAGLTLGCDTPQGYLFMRPMDLDTLERLIGLRVATSAPAPLTET